MINDSVFIFTLQLTEMAQGTESEGDIGCRLNHTVHSSTYIHIPHSNREHNYYPLSGKEHCSYNPHSNKEHSYNPYSYK